MEKLSAFSQQLASRTSKVREEFPDPTRLTEARRWNLYQVLGRMIGHTYLEKIDGAYGSKIWTKVESSNPGESHYDRCFHHLLKRMEFGGAIQPGKTKLLEVTSGSAGVSFGWIAKMLGYPSQIVIPEELPLARRRAIEETVDEVTPSGRPGEYLEGAVRTFRDIIGLRENKILRQQKKLALPNHSQNEFTPESFEAIGKEIIKELPRNLHLDAFVCAIGNGTSIVGITRALREKFGKSMCVHGFQDAEKEGRVTLFGAGGAGNLPMPYVKADMFDQVTHIAEEDWLPKFEEYNKGKQRLHTIGRTSAAALAIAERMIEQHKRAMNILVLFYDKADRYGDEVVTNEQATYTGNGHWTSGTPCLDDLLSRHTIQSRLELKLHLEPYTVQKARERLAAKAEKGILTRQDIERELSYLPAQWETQLDEEDKVNILKYLEKHYTKAYLAAVENR